MSLIKLAVIVIATYACGIHSQSLKQKYLPPATDDERLAARVAMENANYFGGDIIYHRKRSSRNAVPSNTELWPNGLVPFVIDPKLYKERRLIHDAMNEYHLHTCIKFIRRTTEYDYLYITPLSGCYSYLGKSGGAQNVSLSSNCFYVGTIIHELGHAIGRIHEHQRSDRDDYINVIIDNVAKNQLDQFEKMKPEDNRIIESYDYDSIMHYGPKSFSDNSKDTLVPKQKNVALKDTFDKYGFSRLDILVLNKLYDCQQTYATDSS